MPVINLTCVSELSQLLGKQLHSPAIVEVNQKLIDEFGFITRDLQWIHSNPERAKVETTAGSTIAQGLLTLSFVPHFLTETVRVSGVKMGLGCEFNHVLFLKPVPVTSRLSARIQLKTIHQQSGHVDAVWRIGIFIAESVSPVCLCEWKVRYVLALIEGGML
jgi:acyl dehydratase